MYATYNERALVVQNKAHRPKRAQATSDRRIKSSSVKRQNVTTATSLFEEP